MQTSRKHCLKVAFSKRLSPTRFIQLVDSVKFALRLLIFIILATKLLFWFISGSPQPLHKKQNIALTQAETTLSYNIPTELILRSKIGNFSTLRSAVTRKVTKLKDYLLPATSKILLYILRKSTEVQCFYFKIH